MTISSKGQIAFPPTMRRTEANDAGFTACAIAELNRHSALISRCMSIFWSQDS
jgi:hypothetical protein